MTTQLIITRCPTCGSDQISKVQRDWTGKHRGQSYTVPNLEFYECPICQERVFDREALRQIRACLPSVVKQSRKQRSKQSVLGTDHPELVPV